MIRVVVPVATMMASPVIFTTVHAAEAPDGEKVSQSNKKLVKPSQLSIYGDPVPPVLEFTPEKVTTLRKNVSTVRKAVWDYMDTMQESSGKVKDAYDVSKKYTNDMLTYIQEDTGVLQRAGIITVAGLGGIVAGYKGGIVRKAFFATAGMATAAAICYPHQAVDMTSGIWQRSKKDIMDAWNQQTKAKSESPTPAKEEAKVEPVKDATAEAPKETITPSKSDLDFGQSKAEDKDMYTTRGS